MDQGLAIMRRDLCDLGANIPRSRPMQKARRRTRFGHAWEAWPQDLRLLMKMPVDIFSEICCNLRPLDLRHLSLASRRIREIVMSCEFRQTWKAARRNVPYLPDCHPFLSEPQYAFLVFTTQCFKCDLEGTFVNCFFGTRFCPECHPKNSIASDQAKRMYPELPSRLLTLAGSSATRVIGSFYTSRARLYSPQLLELIYFEFSTLTSGSETVEEELLEDLTTKWKQRVVSAKWAEVQICTYISDQRNAETEAKEKRYARRLTCVEGQLKQLGYAREDIPQLDDGFQSLIRRDEEMTPDVWEILRPTFVSLVLERRIKRLAIEAEIVINKRRERLEHRFESAREDLFAAPGLAKFPSNEVLYDIPAVLAITGCQAVEVDDFVWVAAFSEVICFISCYRTTILQRLTSILSNGAHEDKPTPPVETSTEEDVALVFELSRATSAFWCSWCQSVRWYPQAIDHCTHLHPNALAFECLTPLPESCETLIPAILSALDLEQTASLDEMIAEGGGMLCTLCDPRLAKIMSVTELITHYVKSQSWFDSAKAASMRSIARNGDGMAHLHHDHDWSQSPHFFKQPTHVEKRTLVKLQKRFFNRCNANPEDDPPLVSDKDITIIGPRLTRTCTLCPIGFSPMPMASDILKLHIEMK